MKGLIAWFADNHVAANLLMFAIIAAGLLAMATSRLEIFPEISPNLVNVTVVQPGATPEEIELGITAKIEDAVDGIDGVKRITSRSNEGMSLVSAELYYDADKDKVVKDIETAVDAIATLPPDAEKPLVIDVKAPQVVLSVAIAGDLAEQELRALAQRTRDDIASLDAVSRVDITSGRGYEIAIEISEEALRRHGLTFDSVAAAVRGASINISAGSIKTRESEILLRADSQGYAGRDFEDIVLLRDEAGTRVRLADVATVHDAFQDVDSETTFDGKPAYLITVFRVGDQSAPAIADAVHAYIKATNDRLPEGVKLVVWRDYNVFLQGRLSLMLKNAWMGLILVFITLALFLRLRLAFWVAMGIPMAFLGALWLMPFTGATINMMSLFAFIVVLGIVVDDAIVVSENIFYHVQRGVPGPVAAKRGTWEVTVPVFLAMATTVAAFYPMLSMPGTIGQFAGVIPVIVISVLVFSLIEAYFVLPAHLSSLTANPRVPRGPLGWWARFQGGFANFIDTVVIKKLYRPSLEFALRWRYLTLATGVGLVALTAGLVGAGVIKTSFFPPIDGDNMVASLTMPDGTPVEVTRAAIERIRDAGMQLGRELDEEYRQGQVSCVDHVSATVGSQPQIQEVNWDKGEAGALGLAHVGEVNIQLIPSEEREGMPPTQQLMQRWRELVGPVADALELRYSANIMRAGEAVNVRFTSGSFEHLRGAADDLKQRLGNLPGVLDIRDSLRPGKEQLVLHVTPEGEALGLSEAEIARQVRQAYFGEEAQRVQRGRDEVKIRVRYSSAERRELASLDAMRIRTPDGREIPLMNAASVTLGRGPAAIERSELSRAVNVLADVDPAQANADEVRRTLSDSILPAIVANYPDMGFTFEGEERERAESMKGFARGGLIALIAIFTILALAFRSYVQPVIVMIAIPLGAVGAVLAHGMLGKDLTFLSNIGLLAMAGVAVNDSIVLIDFINRARRAGKSAWVAVKEAGPRRFRAILLTSLTTFAGLAPLLFERSIQAQFLIPMAISLAFGVLFATFVTLMIVPSTYLIIEDIAVLLRGKRSRMPHQSTPSHASTGQNGDMDEFGLLGGDEEDAAKTRAPEPQPYH